MLPPFIIEQIRRREQEERERDQDQRPVLELPLPMPSQSVPHGEDRPSEEPERGVVIIDLLG
ncbi:MAG TPA: hypothetical protein RMF84_01950 [Polyangiaceae bacterium LLY-WYZ-14_1]|jgi:hypothetical protein|nr:hypothetical protein [Polyangiaceae bacterium LLY-WYZ-14_1]